MESLRTWMGCRSIFSERCAVVDACVGAMWLGELCYRFSLNRFVVQHVGW